MDSGKGGRRVAGGGAGPGADAEEAVYTSDEAERRFEILARQVFVRFKALVMEPSAFTYAERHDNLEAIYKTLEERRDSADVSELLKELHRIVNEAIRAAEPGEGRRDRRDRGASCGGVALWPG